MVRKWSTVPISLSYMTQVMSELPAKTEKVAMVAMEAKQQELYHATVQRVKVRFR
jgi:hypothetical protein